MKTTREFKGKSLLSFPENYTVIDIETSGLSSEASEIIEISAIKYVNFEKVSSFSTLIKPQNRISYFITNLTGITNDMVQCAPDISKAILDFYGYIGKDILMGYNVNFDVNFLYDNLMRCHNIPLTNDFVDVLRFARKALPNLKNRSQTTVAEYYGISAVGAHRAERDCEICNACYLKLKEESVFAEIL